MAEEIELPNNIREFIAAAEQMGETGRVRLAVTSILAGIHDPHLKNITDELHCTLIRHLMTAYSWALRVEMVATLLAKEKDAGKVNLQEVAEKCAEHFMKARRDMCYIIEIISPPTSEEKGMPQ